MEWSGAKLHSRSSLLVVRVVDFVDLVDLAADLDEHIVVRGGSPSIVHSITRNELIASAKTIVALRVVSVGGCLLLGKVEKS